MNKLIASSMDENKISLTLKGAVILIAIALLPKLGIDLSANEVTLFIETATVVVAGIATLVGIIRKVYIGMGLENKDNGSY